MFALRRASNIPLRTRLHCLRTTTNSYILLHQISPIQSNNLHQTQPYLPNLFTFHGFCSKSGLAKINGEEQQLDGFSELVDTVAKADEEDSKEEVIKSAPSSVNVHSALDKLIEEVRAKMYKSLLSKYVLAGNANKAEQVFDKMRDLGFLVNAYAYQQMIQLYIYMQFDKKKIASVLLLMEKNGVKPTPFIYQLLIEAKGKANDIPGMEKLVEAMKSDGLELNNSIRAVLARRYITAGFHDKAGQILKEMEGDDLEENSGVCKVLLPLYAALGKGDEVERIWKVCESDDSVNRYLAAISAFGKLGRVEKAEEIFEKRSKLRKLSSKGYAALLNVYVDHKLYAKGKDLVKRMASDSQPVDRFVLDSIVKLYVDAGEVEKADSVLQEAKEHWGMKPSYKSYKSLHLIFDQYSRKGDIHNTERIFDSLKQSGCARKISDYQSLLQAYVIAKAPAYGFRERMKADNLFPNKFVAAQLAEVDPFKKTAISDFPTDGEHPQDTPQLQNVVKQ